jgi:hypothetical protein
MYPHTQKINLAEAEVESIRDALRGAILTLEVEKNSIADISQDFDADLQAVMGLGVLMNDLQMRRVKLQAIGHALPSPNQVAAELREKMVKLQSRIFETGEHLKNIQSETYRLARLNLKAASHKINFVSKVQAHAAKEHLTAVA